MSVLRVRLNYRLNFSNYFIRLPFCLVSVYHSLRFVFVFAFTFLLLPSCFAGTPKSPWDTELEKAHDLERVGSWEPAEQAYKRSIEIAKASHANQENVYLIKIKLATILVREGKFATAEPIYQEIMNINVVTPSNRTAKATRESIVCLDDLGDSYCASMTNRQDCLLHALAIKQKLYGDRGDERLLNTLNQVFLFYKSLGRYAESAAILKREISILKSEAIYQKKLSSLADDANRKLLNVLVELVGVELAASNYEEYEKFSRQGYSLALDTHGAKHVITKSFAGAMVACMVRKGDLEKGLEWANKSTEDVNAGKPMTVSSSPEALVIDNGNKVAAQHRKDHKYEDAKKLELNLIDFVKTHSEELKSETPIFYLILSMNAAAQGSALESKVYFEESKQSCSNQIARSALSQQALSMSLATLYDCVDSDRKEGKLELAIADLNHILIVEQLLFAYPVLQYGAISRLADAFEAEQNHRESEKCLMRAISLSRMPTSFVKNELPELYMRLGISQYAQSKTDAANASFAESLKAVMALEKGVESFRHTTILLRWGMACKDAHKYSAASAKFEEVLQSARSIPPASRGTLLADVLEAMVDIENDNGRGKLPRAQKLHQQSLAEIKIQRNLISHLGPDFYHRM